jgi:hypothetical protein
MPHAITHTGPYAITPPDDTMANALVSATLAIATGTHERKAKMTAEEYAEYKQRQREEAAARERNRLRELERKQAEYDAAAAPYREARRARKAAQLARGRKP